MGYEVLLHLIVSHFDGFYYGARNVLKTIDVELETVLCP